MRVDRIQAQATYPLRWAILRPDQPPESVIFDGDADQESVHFGACDEAGEVCGVASMFHKGPAADAPHVLAAPAHVRALLASTSAWQLRGMATSGQARGKGVGGLLLKACLHHVATVELAVITTDLTRDAVVPVRLSERYIFWCNARETVEGFYRRYGLVVSGSAYDVPTVGPHIFMWKILDI